jgi:hypothetical protein
MLRRFKNVSALDGIRQLGAELSIAAYQLNARGVLFFVQSGKRLHLLDSKANPPRSILVRQNCESTLGYTTAIPYGDPMQDALVEVVRDSDGQLHFRACSQLLSAREFAAKLLNLLATEIESA